TSLKSAASRLKMPLSDSATPARNSRLCASAARRPSPALPGAASATTPRSRTVNQRAARVLPSVVMGFSLSVEQRFALTAVERDHRAVHEARALGRHEHRDVGDLLRRADAPEGNAALGALLRIVDADPADLGDPGDEATPALGGHGPRIDGVD